MKIIHNIANIMILLGAANLIGGVLYKMFIIEWFGLAPSSFLDLAKVCLLLGIALYIRELVPKEKQ